MTAKERLVIDLIKEEPSISQENLAKKANMSRAAVSVHISNLLKKGYILGRGYIVDDSPFVLVVGATSLDSVGQYSEDAKKYVEKNGRITVFPGGVANNIATTLIKMGCETSYISAFGNDMIAPVLKKQMEERGFDLQYCYDDPDCPTSYYIGMLNEKKVKEAAISSYEIFDNFKLQHMQENKTLFSRASILVTECNIPTRALEFALDACANPVYLDAVSVEKALRAKPLLGRFDTVKVNVDQAEALSGLKIESELGLKKVADGLLATGIRRVLITIGENGTYIKSRTNERFVRIKNNENVASYVGSGDVFFAGLIYGELKGLDEEKAISIAQYVSELSFESLALDSDKIKVNKIKQMVKELKG